MVMPVLKPGDFDGHDEKMAFIRTMPNRYDYPAFQEFCQASGHTTPPFRVYAALVDSLDNTPGSGGGIASASPCGTCGGGKVR